MSDELRFLRGMPKAEALRLAYLEGREELFPTKLLRVVPEREDVRSGRQILVLSRDPGSGNALAPVLELLRKEEVEVQTVVDGRAEEIFRKRFPVEVEQEEGLAALESAVTPDVLLTGPSEEPGIEVAAAATYPQAPMVVLDVYYGDSLRLFRKLKERGIPLPSRVCVMDQEAARINVEHYPELADRMGVTGLPSFDRFATEDTAGIGGATREKLGLGQDEKVVVWMATIVARFGAGDDEGTSALYRNLPTPPARQYAIRGVPCDP